MTTRRLRFEESNQKIKVASRTELKVQSVFLDTRYPIVDNDMCLGNTHRLIQAETVCKDAFSSGYKELDNTLIGRNETKKPSTCLEKVSDKQSVFSVQTKSKRQCESRKSVHTITGRNVQG